MGWRALGLGWANDYDHEAPSLGFPVGREKCHDHENDHEQDRDRDHDHELVALDLARPLGRLLRPHMQCMHEHKLTCIQ